MSAEIKFLQLLDNLSPRDRSLYILIESYKQFLNTYGNTDLGSDMIEQFFSVKFNNFLVKTDNHKEIKENKIEKTPIMLRDEKLDTQLGDWASSFSESSDK